MDISHLIATHWAAATLAKAGATLYPVVIPSTNVRASIFQGWDVEMPDGHWEICPTFKELCSLARTVIA